MGTPLNKENSLETTIYQQSGVLDPSVDGYEAPIGTIYQKLSSPTGLFQKLDEGFSTNWQAFDTAPPLGYTPENISNKATDFTTVNNTLYPTVQATQTEIAAQIADHVAEIDPHTQYELKSNKATDFTTVNDTLYPTVQATETEIAAKIAEHVGYTDPHPQYVLDSDVNTLLNGITAIPTGSATSATTVTSASTTFVDVMSCLVQLTQANNIHGIGIANLTATTAAALAAFRTIVEIPEVTTFTALADVASSLNNKYLTFSKTTGAFYVWFNVGGAGVDPAPGGTGIMVAFAANSTAQQVASAIITAMAAHGGNAVAGDVTKFRIINTVGGNVTDATAGTSGFSFVIDQQGAASSNGQQSNESIQNTTDTYTVSAQHIFAASGAGFFWVKSQISRVSGTGTVNFVRGSIFGQGQQAVINSITPSRIIYVSKNGGGVGADGTWNKPFASIATAVAAAQNSPSDFNTPVAIALAPGVGTTQYSDTAPVTITKGGICIYSMSSQDFKASMVQYSGSFIYNLVGTNLFSALIGFEINCPAGAAWNSQPASIYCTGVGSYRVFLGSMVANSNASTRHAIYCDNPNATITVTNSEVKTGVSGSPNLTAVNMQAGVIILRQSEIANRQSGNIGAAIELSGTANVTLNDGDLGGNILKNSNSSNLIVNGDTIISGSNPCIVTQATQGTGAVSIWYAIFNSTAPNAVTGGENVLVGNIVYPGTCNDVDSALNGGTGIAMLKSELDPRYRGVASNWASTPPATLREALLRMESLLKTLNGGNPIP